MSKRLMLTVGWTRTLLLRIYSPLPPYFDKSWAIGQIELVK